MKILIVLCLAFCLVCCADSKVINGVEYEPYGLIDCNEVKNDSITYRVVTGNVIWGVLGFETVVAPVCLFGFYLYEPVAPKYTQGNAGE